MYVCIPTIYTPYSYTCLFVFNDAVSSVIFIDITNSVIPKKLTNPTVLLINQMMA